MDITIHNLAEFYGDVPSHLAAMMLVSADDLAKLQAAAQAQPPALTIAGQPATQAAIDDLVAYQTAHP